MENYDENLKYLKLLARQYPTIADACTEIINLQAILNLPKGTEHFLLIFMVNMNLLSCS